MANLLVAAIILLYSFQSGFCNMYGKNYPGEKSRTSQIYSIFYGLIVGIITLVVSGFTFAPSPMTWIIGTINGVVLVAYNTFLLMASAKGPYSIVMIFNLTGGVLLPMLYYVLFGDKKLSTLKICTIAVMLVAFVLINLETKKDPKDESNQKKPGFLLFCFLLGCMNGIYGILMEGQRSATNGTENGEMIIVTFVVSTIAALAILLINTKGKCASAFRQTPKSALFMVLASVSAAVAVNLLMHALSLINAPVLYTLDNGGVLLVSVLWSVIFFKEKLNPQKIIGLILAAACLVLLSVPEKEAVVPEDNAIVAVDTTAET